MRLRGLGLNRGWRERHGCEDCRERSRGGRSLETVRRRGGCVGTGDGALEEENERSLVPVRRLRQEHKER